MENKINIAELLKDCPKGMELDCVLYENVKFECVLDANCYPIQVQTYEGKMLLSKYGCLSLGEHAKCVIFPKGKTTWEGFQRPFKDGDIVYSNDNRFPYISIYQSDGENNLFHYHVSMTLTTIAIKPRDVKINGNTDKRNLRLATKKEERMLFYALKAHGYKWNDKAKTLEKLVETKFKVGDIVQYEYGYGYKVKITEVNIDDKLYEYESVIAKGIGGIPFSEQDDWELVPNKFDITTLKPFESRVLCRDGYTEKWKSNFWGFYDNAHAMNYPFECCGTSYAQCIPYEGNEHLLGTTDDCDDFYKNWEK